VADYRQGVCSSAVLITRRGMTLLRGRRTPPQALDGTFSDAIPDSDVPNSPSPREFLLLSVGREIICRLWRGVNLKARVEQASKA